MKIVRRFVATSNPFPFTFDRKCTVLGFVIMGVVAQGASGVVEISQLGQSEFGAPSKNVIASLQGDGRTADSENIQADLRDTLKLPMDANQPLFVHHNLSSSPYVLAVIEV